MNTAEALKKMYNNVLSERDYKETLKIRCTEWDKDDFIVLDLLKNEIIGVFDTETEDTFCQEVSICDVLEMLTDEEMEWEISDRNEDIETIRKKYLKR